MAFLLTDGEYVQYISSYHERLAESHAVATQLIPKHKISYLNTNASLCLMVNLAAACQGQEVTDGEILSWLWKKVYLTSGTSYRSEVPRWFRVVSAHPRYVLDEGLKRVGCALR